MAGQPATARTGPRGRPGTIGSLIASYKESDQYGSLRPTSKKGYKTRLEQIRKDHGHRAVAGLNQDRIKTYILAPYAERLGARLDILGKLRI